MIEIYTLRLVQSVHKQSPKCLEGFGSPQKSFKSDLRIAALERLWLRLQHVEEAAQHVGKVLAEGFCVW